MPEHQCDECEAQFHTKMAYDAHRQVFHGDGHAPWSTEDWPFAQVTFRCAFCGREYPRHQELRDHLQRCHAADLEQRGREIAERTALLGKKARGRGRRRLRSGAAA